MEYIFEMGINSIPEIDSMYIYTFPSLLCLCLVYLSPSIRFFLEYI